MAKNEINKKILDFIDETDYDKDIKLFLKDCLDIEFNRVKTGTDKFNLSKCFFKIGLYVLNISKRRERINIDLFYILRSLMWHILLQNL